MLRKLGVLGAWVDEQGRICIECLFCDSIHYNMVGHLREDHASNPVAQRIIELIENRIDADCFDVGHVISEGNA